MFWQNLCCGVTYLERKKRWMEGRGGVEREREGERQREKERDLSGQSIDCNEM